jgi:hypothetical protein
MWPPQSSQRFILQRGIIFILDISMEIHRGRHGVFSTPETVPYLLPSSPRDNVVFFRSLVSSQSSTSSEFLCADEDEPSSTYSIPFRGGLIGLVATLSGGMIELMVSLSSRISFLPPIFMIFIS